MTVKQVGRPNRSAERRSQILEAAASVVARNGVTGATMSSIAEEAGLQRTLVLHYFGDRESLIQAFIEEAVAIYGSAMILENGDPALSPEERVRAMFAPKFYPRLHLKIWLELVALASRDPDVRSRFSDLWRKRWLPVMQRQIGDAFPDAPKGAVETVAYGLVCIFEGHWALVAQGAGGPEHREQAADAAVALLTGVLSTTANIRHEGSTS